MPDNKQKNTKSQAADASRDLVIIGVISVVIFILSYFFDIFVFIVRFLEKYPKKIIYIDEVVTILLTLSIAFAIFAWRRWLELKKETAERIRLQEELTRIADIKAETERIISKQLHSELEHRKHLESPKSPKVKR